MLLGYYPFDDEGVPAQHVQLVDHGVLKTFLMSRPPLVNSRIPMGTAAASSATCRFRARET